MPCFRVSLKYLGLVMIEKNNLCRSIESSYFVRGGLDEKKSRTLVIIDINFYLFILLFFSTIKDTRTMLYFMNAKFKIHQDMPNNLQKWFKVHCFRKWWFILKHLTTQLSNLILQASIIYESTDCSFSRC